MDLDAILAQLVAVEANPDALISGDLAEVKRLLPTLTRLPADQLADHLIAWAREAPGAVSQLLSAAARADEATAVLFRSAVAACAEIWGDGGPWVGVDDLRIRPVDDRPPLPGSVWLTGPDGWILQVAPGDEIVLGRAEIGLGHVPAITVARRHALVRHGGDRCTIEDLGSPSGIYRNARRVVGAETLADGDVVRIGTFEITVSR